MQDITDEQVKELVKRCNKLTELILESQSITNETVTNIIEHLPTLKKLSLINSNIDCATFLKFRRMPKICVLNWDMTKWSHWLGSNWLEFGSIEHSNAIQYLKTQGLIINQDIFNVAASQILMDLTSNVQKLAKQCENEVWEIKVKQLQMLPFYFPNHI